jgi:Rrf2 family protein
VNTRFAVAVHVLTLLAKSGGQASTSDYIASSVQTNPVVVRRILGRLREAGFVSAVPGPGGGFVLAVEPRSLTLRQVYEAVAERGLIAVHEDANPRCPVGRNIGRLLEEVAGEAEEALRESLSGTTIETLVRRVARREKAR